LALVVCHLLLHLRHIYIARQLEDCMQNTTQHMQRLRCGVLGVQQGEYATSHKNAYKRVTP
jgi:hypothetical protein